MLIRSSENQGGFILVMVLWLVVLLALQISMFNTSIRDAGFLASNELAIARGEALAAAGVELAAARLREPDASQRWRADGHRREIMFGGARLSITVTDEAGRLDLNELDREVAASLLRPFARSQALVDQWIERLQARPVLDVSEFGRTLNLSPSAMQTLAGYVTVHGGDGKINPLAASRAALLALPGAKAIDIDRALGMSRLGGEREVTAALSSVGKWLTTRAGPAYRVEISVHGDAQPAVGTMEAIILLGKDAGAPLHVLSWRYEPRVGEAERSPG